MERYFSYIKQLLREPLTSSSETSEYLDSRSWE